MGLVRGNTKRMVGWAERMVFGPEEDQEAGR